MQILNPTMIWEINSSSFASFACFLRSHHFFSRSLPPQAMQCSENVVMGSEGWNGFDEMFFCWFVIIMFGFCINAMSVVTSMRVFAFHSSVQRKGSRSENVAESMSRYESYQDFLQCHQYEDQRPIFSASLCINVQPTQPVVVSLSGHSTWKEKKTRPSLFTVSGVCSIKWKSFALFTFPPASPMTMGENLILITANWFNQINR